MTRLSSIIIAALLLSACDPSVAVTCPPLKRYSAEFQRYAVAELGRIDAPHLEQMLNDYGVTRDAIRACITRRKKAGG